MNHKTSLWQMKTQKITPKELQDKSKPNAQDWQNENFQQNSLIGQQFKVQKQSCHYGYHRVQEWGGKIEQESNSYPVPRSPRWNMWSKSWDISHPPGIKMFWNAMKDPTLPLPPGVERTFREFCHEQYTKRICMDLRFDQNISDFLYFSIEFNLISNR